MDAWIEDRKLYVKAQFRLHDERAKGIFKDICEGIIKNVSLGYVVDDIEFKNEANKINGYCKITPFEASVAVGVPADPSVGFYRSMTCNCKGIKSMTEDEKIEKSDVAEADEVKELEQLKKRIDELEEKLEKHAILIREQRTKNQNRQNKVRRSSNLNQLKILWTQKKRLMIRVQTKRK